MGRLIDADAFIKYIDANRYRNGNEKVFSEFDVAEMIDNQPTAYDAEKVAEQLEELMLPDEYQYVIRMAIKIVKAGGK